MKRKYKLLTIVGARPQFIKAAALSKVIAQNDIFEEVILHSGQHYDDLLSGQYFRELGILDPAYNLGIGSGSHNDQISDCIKGVDAVLKIEKPDLVIVFGDTNTTAGASIAAKKSNYLVAHVEAGLREFDLSIPEEVNKRITDVLTDLYFTPTQTGVENLRREGITENVYLTGDIGLDLLFDSSLYVEPRVHRNKFNLAESYVFLTCHREANTNNKENLESILMAITHIEKQVIFPAHPRTAKAIKHFELSHLLGPNIRMIDPLSFGDTQNFIRNAEFVMTDSGGIIKEAYFHGVPGIVIDTQTEWVETVEEGWNTIAGPTTESILKAIQGIKRPSENRQTLGDGKAGIRIMQAIENYLDAR